MKANDPHTQEAQHTEHTENEQQPTAQADEQNTTAEGTEVPVEEAKQAEGTAPDLDESGDQDPRINELIKQVDEGQQRLLRAQADFDNYRRRTVKEKEELAKYASSKLVTELLPVVDNFERAIAAAQGGGDQDSLAKGVEMIFRQLAQVLEQEGLKPMESVGQPFNPEFHQAIMQVESDEHEEGIVVEEVQKGYILKDKVLRPAMVKVSG
ncbi:nucleotide exchange factor GrpE [Paenibacillus daejeonensis]|uniref:nucleotide exchange factor GrpE n=1 Tax=Paenibacillus daejeonensis TaxID=135193 RepID=UPI000363D8EA|nr:nucleotide exchange factor GrpE [Paenibacillus daejeonensis]